MQSPAHARRALSVLALAVTLAACDRAPSTVPPALPWLAEIASISADRGAGLTRCEASGCEPVASRTILAAGARLQLDRGARARITLDEDTDLELRDAAEISLAQEGGEHVVRLAKGTAIVTRSEGALPRSPNVVVLAGGQPIVVVSAVTVEVRTASPGATTAIVNRGWAGLRDPRGPSLLFTGDGARWGEGEAPVPYARWSAAIEDEEEQGTRATNGASAARGLGTMSARVPGTEDIVSGVRLAMHHVRAEVQDGFARTTVEEVFENETKRTLEGRFVFPLPPDASISRLALYVGDDLVEGEIVDKPLASRVFKAIVDDTVRPRDPAILEMKAGSMVSLRVFPIPAEGKRRVILAYDQTIPERGDRARYVYPLSLGPDRATTIDDFSVSVVVKDSAAAVGNAACAGYDASMRVDDQGLMATYSAKRFAPVSDFVLRYSRDEGRAASLSWSVGPKEVAAREAKEKSAGYFALRFQTTAPEGHAWRRIVRPSRAFVIDTSHSQSTDTIDASARVVKAALRELDPQDRFTVLACDSACDSYPEDGLARAGDDAIAAASAWLSRRAPGGSSDLAGALLAASERLSSEGGGQVVYLGDGVATSGELGSSAIAARIAPAFQGLDAHFVGVGQQLDEVALMEVANAVSATYERFSTGDPVAERAHAIARAIDAPVVRDARLTLPEGAFDVLPAKLPRLRLGQEVRVLGRFRPASPKPEGETHPASLREDDNDLPARGPLREVRLTGRVAGAPYEIVRSLDWSRALASPSPAVHALWARAKIASLETSANPDATKEIVRLSTVHHVLSRATALLVLENERMFVETGVRAAIDRVLASEGPATEASPDSGRTAMNGRLSRARGASTAGSTEPFGILGALSQPAPSTVPWGGASDALSARGNMWGDSIGDSFGAGGLGLSGIGEGGGGRGEGIGLGSVGTVGHGAGTGTGSGFGSGHRLSGSHRASAPQVRSGAAAVSGRVPPEVIQRVIRQAFGRFRACYEAGLRTNPNLQGRVSVRFVIDAAGQVMSASNGGSDLPDPTVVACVVSGVTGLSFPPPESGIVTVVYPISFAPESGTSSTTASSTPSSSTTASSTPSSSTTASSTPSPSSSGSAVPPAVFSSHRRAPSTLTTSWAHPVTTAWPKWAPNPGSDGPIVVHRAPEEAPAPGEDKAIAKLLAQVSDPGAPRSAHQALVKKLLASGRFDDAFAASSRYVGLDPDHEVALELYAEAAAATGRSRIALLSVDAQVESDPTRIGPHRRAAAAFEAAGDERRACAHFRAMASLPGADDTATYHALRCRARLGERAPVLAEARALAKPGALVSKLIAALEAGSAPPFEPAPASGSFEARVTCRGEANECPAPIVVGPTGTVVSPWTPATPCARDALALKSVTSGTYRTLVAGELPRGGADLTVRVLGQTKTIALQRAGTTVALATTVTMPDPSSALQ